MRFGTLVKVLQSGEATLHSSEPSHDPVLSGAASLDDARPDQLSFLEKGNALTAALANSAGAVLLPDQHTRSTGPQPGIGLCRLRQSPAGLPKHWSNFTPGRAPGWSFQCRAWRPGGGRAPDGCRTEGLHRFEQSLGPIASSIPAW